MLPAGISSSISGIRRLAITFRLTGPDPASAVGLPSLIHEETGRSGGSSCPYKDEELRGYGGTRALLKQRRKLDRQLVKLGLGALSDSSLLIRLRSYRSRCRRSSAHFSLFKGSC